MRRTAKAINFGIAYGLSAFGLSQRLEMPPEEAQAIIDRYFARYAGVRAWLDAHHRGGAANRRACQTLFGRRRLLPDIHSSNPAVRQAAERMADQHAHPGHRRGPDQARHARASIAALRESGLGIAG